MKVLITILAFVVWCFGSAYWYTCKIKQLCDDTSTETALSQMDMAETPVDTVSITEIIEPIDTLSVLPDSATTQKVYFNKSFNIVFKYKSTDYVSDSTLEKSLKELALFSKSNPNATVEIIGHTDNVGSAPTNLVLGQGRAESVMQTLYKYGSTSGKITATSKGETEPIADNETEEGRKSNRRVQIIIKN